MSGNKLKKGFTLVELLVSAFVFSLVFGSATGILVSSMKIQKYNLSHQQLLDQTSYAAEYMVRALRMAQKDALAGDLTYNISGSSIEFHDYKNDYLRFYLDTNTDQLMVEGVSAAPVALTSDDYEVTNLSFNLSGDAVADGKQPRVTFSIAIQDKRLVDKPSIVLQTSVSHRNLDNE